MICGTAASQEIFLLPGSIYGETDQDFALACVVPRDIQGLTIVEATRPSDRRELEETADVETPDTGITRDGFYSKTFSFPKNGYLCARSINTQPNLSNISRRITEHASVLVFQDKAMS